MLIVMYVCMFFEKVFGSFNGELVIDCSFVFSGLLFLFDFDQFLCMVDDFLFYFGSMLNVEVGKWYVMLIGIYDYDDNCMIFVCNGVEFVCSVIDSVVVDFIINGNFYCLFVGVVLLIVWLGGIYDVFQFEIGYVFVFEGLGFDWMIGVGLLNIDVFLIKSLLFFIGCLLVNGNVIYCQLFDFGGLISYGFGFIWVLELVLWVIGLFVWIEIVLMMQQFGNLWIIILFVLIFDFIIGQSVFVISIIGGNFDL